MSASAVVSFAEPPRLEGGDSYTLFDRVDRVAARRIFRKTGLHIAIPPGEGFRRLGTTLDEAEIALGGGADGIFCLGQSDGEGTIVGIKISRKGPDAEVVDRVRRVGHTLQVIESFGQGDCTYEVMDVAGCGTLDRLFEVMPKLPPWRREQFLYLVAKDLLSALEGLHGRSVCHADVKPDNVLLDRNGRVRLGDFGRSRLVIDGDAANGEAGFWAYQSPEMVHAVTHSKEYDRFKADSWSAGLTLLSLLLPWEQFWPLVSGVAIEIEYGTSQWEIDCHLEGKIAAKLAAIPELVDPPAGSVWKLIKGLLAFDPGKRLFPGEALKCDWIANMGRDNSREELGRLIPQLLQPPQSASPQDLPSSLRSYRVKRGALVRSVMEALGRSSLTILQGAPGMGKSELATEIVNRHDVRKRYETRLWFSGSDTRASLETHYSRLAREWGLVDESAPAADAIKAVCEHLRGQGSCLMVFDNADDPELLRPFLPEGVTVLVTSRSDGWGREVRVPVERLTREEGIELVRKLLDCDVTEAEQLCERLNGIPLSLSQACAYIANQQITIAEYIGRLPQLVAADELQDGRSFEYQIQEMYALTLAALPTPALELMRCLCFLHPDAIPYALCAESSQEMELLEGYALIQPGSGETFVIHRRTWEEVRKLAPDQTLARAMEMLASHFVLGTPNLQQLQSNERLIPHGAELLRHLDGLPEAPVLRRGRVITETWVLRAGIAAGRRTLLEPILRRPEPQCDDAEVMSQLFNARGAAWCELGERGKARASYQRAQAGIPVGHLLVLESREGAFDAEHRESPSYVSRLDVAELRALLDARLRLHRRDDVPMAAIYQRLGHFLSRLHPQFAEPYLRQTLRIRLEAFGKSHPDIITTLRSLAQVVPPAESLELLRSALAIGSDVHDRGDLRRLELIIELADREEPERLLPLLTSAVEEADAVIATLPTRGEPLLDRDYGIWRHMNRIVELTSEHMTTCLEANDLFDRLSDLLKKAEGDDSQLAAGWEKRGDYLGREGRHRAAVAAYAHALATRHGEAKKLFYRIYLQRMALGQEEAAEGAYRQWMEVSRRKRQEELSGLKREQQKWRERQKPRDPPEGEFDISDPEWSLYLIQSTMTDYRGAPVKELEQRSWNVWGDRGLPKQLFEWQRIWLLKRSTYREPDRLWWEALSPEVVKRLMSRLERCANRRAREETAGKFGADMPGWLRALGFGGAVEAHFSDDPPTASVFPKSSGFGDYRPASSTEELAILDPSHLFQQPLQTLSY
jgi:serine/threonine protein kinase/tetratricopeptide (TPR) repeat protein